MKKILHLESSYILSKIIFINKRRISRRWRYSLSKDIQIYLESRKMIE